MENPVSKHCRTRSDAICLTGFQVRMGKCLFKQNQKDKNLDETYFYILLLLVCTRSGCVVVGSLHVNITQLFYQKRSEHPSF